MLEVFGVANRGDDGFFDAWMLEQGRFDLAQLDTMAPKLHLEVGTAQELDVAIWQITPQVTGPVEA